MSSDRHMLVLVLAAATLCGTLALRSAGGAPGPTQSSTASRAPLTERVRPRASRSADSLTDQLVLSGVDPSILQGAVRLEDYVGPSAQLRIERERLEQEGKLYRELKQNPNRTELQTSMLRNLEETTRYPTSNRRFAIAKHDPVLREHAPQRREKRSADGITHLSVWTDSAQYDLGADILIEAELLRGPGDQQPEPVRGASLSATLQRDGSSSVLAELSLRDDGDGHYRAGLSAANVAGRPLTAGAYRVVVSNNDGLTQATELLLRPGYARLTGAYRDALEQGQLVIEVELDAFEDGDYHLLASLYTDDDLPIGVAEVTQTLSAGTHWVALKFHGRLVHDGGRDGPYRLAHISVDKDGARGVRSDPNHLTARYRLQDLSSEPYYRLDSEEQ